MNKRELNRDILRLWNSFDTLRANRPDYFLEWVDTRAKKEYLRLYSADGNMEYMNSKSIKIMIILNRRWNFVPLHNFGPSTLI